MSSDSSRLKIAVTGKSWMGGGIDSLETEIEKIFNHARKEIQIAAYSIRDRAPGLFEMLANATRNGVVIKMMVNRFDEHPEHVRSKLLELEQKSEGFLLYKYVPVGDEDDLHAKIIVADREIALLGSANLTWRGLVSNHEIGIILRNEDAAKIGRLLDLLVLQNPQVKQIGMKAP